MQENYQSAVRVRGGQTLFSESQPPHFPVGKKTGTSEGATLSQVAQLGLALSLLDTANPTPCLSFLALFYFLVPLLHSLVPSPISYWKRWIWPCFCFCPLPASHFRPRLGHSSSFLCTLFQYLEISYIMGRGPEKWCHQPNRLTCFSHFSPSNVHVSPLLCTRPQGRRSGPEA